MRERAARAHGDRPAPSFESAPPRAFAARLGDTQKLGDLYIWNVAENKDWVSWHDQYDDPQSSLSKRLRFVQARLSDALDRVPPGPVNLVSLCAGQGRDVIGVLSGHPRRSDVTAVLVEFDPVNVGLARTRAAEAGLVNVDVREADAGLVANYGDALPAHVLLLCGIFGNVPADDIQRTAFAAADMCRPGGTVIWTRHRREPDLTPVIRAWFADAGFDEVAFDSDSASTLTGVGVGRRRGSGGRPPRQVPSAEPLFTFQRR